MNEVKKHRKGSGLFNVSLQPRTWKLRQEDKKLAECMEESVDDLGRGIVFTRKDKIHSVVMQTREAVGNKVRPASGER